jgi:type IV secretory pathway VirB10-like protein
MGATIPALKFPGRHTLVQRVATSGCRFGSRGLRAPGTGDGGGTSEQVERCPTEGSPNMRTSMAYFAGAGTVIAAIVGGVGGGLLIADMVSPKSPKQGVEQTRLERRTSPAPIPAANAPSEPVQYLAASQLPPSGATEPVPAPTQTQADNSASKPPQPVDAAAAPQPAAQAPQPAAAAVQPVAREQTAAADDAVARTRDGDSRRAVEKRRTERHQHWADRRRHQPRQEQELQAVDERGREEIEPRREFAPEPERGTRVIRLFGLE